MRQIPGQFTQEIRVYYADTDAGGIVYHARYLEFAERCRSEFLRHIGCPLVSDEGNNFVVRRAQIEWHAPARLDDLLICQTLVISARGAKVNMEHRFFAGEVMTTQISVELAYITKALRPARLPASLIAAMLPPSEM
ncbi:YbgC/FadM family acyl-CoA thioesterase [Xinfangfangia sp. D13-10-4-6]|uniref:YbgC/FadM family acyl-CoA thioesterase n=1 Tax=Pseudogemmobacter hezensis TaxID=2737662 RepID=UPI001556EB64|nr:YbgC/FadM family acyl-CoA thioesterase [Pseudogemmobacter hezensis]